MDESDYLTRDAQAALRNLMETFSKSTRFILTCNYPEKVIDPIQSRCQTFEIIPPTKKDVAKRLNDILINEGIQFEMQDLAVIVNSGYPDIRRVINAAIIPKGNGAIVAAIPDGTAVGGNARGAYAVDLQTTRSSSADRVAGGSYSFIGGGNNNGLGIAPYSVIVGGQSNRINDATGGQSQHAFIGGGSSNYIDRSGPSVICGGSSNTIGRPSSFIGGGGPNTVSGFLSVIVGGTSNSVGNVDYASIVGGVSNTASANYATIGGGQSNTASGGWATVAGGRSNGSTNSYTTVCGGYNNQATFTYDTICGGDSNSLTGTNNSQNRFIGGGSQNGINAEQTNGSLIVGGLSNKIYRGAGSFIVGGGWGNGGVPNMVAATSSGILGGAKNNIGRTSPALYNIGSLIGITHQS